MAVREPDDPTPAESDPGGVGVGELTAEDRRWQQAAAELDPARSLARADDKAKQVISTVSVLGVLLSGLGLVVVTRLQVLPLARWLAVATVVAAVGSVVLALWALLLRERDVLVNDLEAVRGWYEDQFRRARLVRAAGRLLLVGVLLAGLTGLAALTTNHSQRPVVEVVVSGTGAEQTARARVRWPGLPPTRLVTVTLAGTGGQVLAQGLASPDADGTATVTFEAVKPQGATRLVVSIVAGRSSCTATLTLSQSGARLASAMLTCQHT